MLLQQPFLECQSEPLPGQ